jgi:DivIVA domain-containing protein
MMLTPGDVHAVRFAKPPFGRRGYDEEEVDAFLDQVVQTLITLHDELARLRGSASPDLSFGTSTAAEHAMLAELDQIKQRLSRIEAAVRR